MLHRGAGPSSAPAFPETAAALEPAGSPFRRTDLGVRHRSDAADAVTANAHRIHCHWPYATRVEGYPGLVVHGR
ncbi:MULTISPECIES: hypothetical protein [Amycolatopsis]|uniref:hypothetical protein n=1 Tax=Amycolatopsis TaxID=1813 RepID=UPI0007DF5CD0|nr:MULTISPECIES: hypothetical protein [Amycolatopsis]OAP29133.1 hypothetical protein A4R44_00927 [Amycolatopsis sp. M39]